MRLGVWISRDQGVSLQSFSGLGRCLIDQAAWVTIPVQVLTYPGYATVDLFLALKRARFGFRVETDFKRDIVVAKAVSLKRRAATKGLGQVCYPSRFPYKCAPCPPSTVPDPFPLYLCSKSLLTDPHCIPHFSQSAFKEHMYMTSKM